MPQGRLSGTVFGCGSAVISTLLAAGCADPARVPEWCAAETSGVEVRIEAEPISRNLRLEEVWRVGGMDGEATFSRPSRAAVSPQGRVAVPDMGASAVIVVEPDGTWRGSIVREGDGPGEVRWPVDVEWTDEGELVVFDLAKGEVVRLSETGRLLDGSWRIDPDLYGRIAASGSLPGGDLTGAGGLILELPWEATPDDPKGITSTVLRLGPDGTTDTIQVQSVEAINEGPFRMWPVPGAPRPLYAAGPVGPLYRAGANRHYRLVISSAALVDSVVVCRNVQPLPYTPAELGESDPPTRLSAMLEAAPRPDEPAAIGGLLASANGGLWVLRNRPDPSAPQTPIVGGTYDYFNEVGEYVGAVQVPSDVYLVGEGGGQVYGFERGPYDEVSLVAYRLVMPND